VYLMSPLRGAPGLKTRLVGAIWPRKKVDHMFSCLNTMYVCDGQTEDSRWLYTVLTHTVAPYNKLCAGGRHNMPPPPCKFTFDLLTLRVVPESRVTWATSVSILVFLVLSVLDLGPMYATDRRQRDKTSDTHHRLMPPPYVGRG